MAEAEQGGGWLCVIPDYVFQEADALISALVAGVPDAERDRATLRSQLLGYYDAFGRFPPIGAMSLQPPSPPGSTEETT
jgi:hypothetical protein